MSSNAESVMKSDNKGKSKASKPILRSDRADLQFSISRIKRFLKNGKYADKIDEMAPVYLAGVLEYLAGEVSDLAGKIAKGENKKIIKPRHISLAVQNDAELSKLFEGLPFHVLVEDSKFTTVLYQITMWNHRVVTSILWKYNVLYDFP